MSARLQPAVEAIGVNKQFGSTRALRSVDIAIQPGRCLGLVGRNGAGKSTLVSILSGLLAPRHGRGSLRRTARPGARQYRRVAQPYLHRLPALDGRPRPHRRGKRLPRPPATPPRCRRLAVDALGDAPRPARVGLRREPRQAVLDADRRAAPDRRDHACTGAGYTHAAARRTDRGARSRRRSSAVRARTCAVAGGVAVLYISHHLEEVFEICQDVAVIRDGELVSYCTHHDLTNERL